MTSGNELIYTNWLKRFHSLVTLVQVTSQDVNEASHVLLLDELTIKSINFLRNNALAQLSRKYIKT